MMKSFKDSELEDLRLVLLRLLAQATGYSCNAYLLRQRAEQYGHQQAMAIVRAQLAWLRDRALVQLVDDEALSVATLSDAGLDVAQGRLRLPGVSLPAPGVR